MDKPELCRAGDKRGMAATRDNCIASGVCCLWYDECINIYFITMEQVSSWIIGLSTFLFFYSPFLLAMEKNRYTPATIKWAKSVGLFGLCVYFLTVFSMWGQPKSGGFEMIFVALAYMAIITFLMIIGVAVVAVHISAIRQDSAHNRKNMISSWLALAAYLACLVLILLQWQ